MKQVSIVAWLLFTLSPAFTAADHICLGSGPQTPRDISQKFGTNTSSFNLAPSYRDMNLCNIHTHIFAEHKGPGFSISANNGQTDGYRCNDTAGLSQEELTDPTHGSGAFQGFAPGDTIEVHWVYSSCAVQPGQIGLLPQRRLCEPPTKGLRRKSFYWSTTLMPSIFKPWFMTIR